MPENTTIQLRFHTPTFRLSQDTVGVDTERLEAVQLNLLRLHEACHRSGHGSSLDGGSASAAERDAVGQAVRDALGQAMERLLRDLDSHAKMLGAGSTRSLPPCCLSSLCRPMPAPRCLSVHEGQLSHGLGVMPGCYKCPFVDGWVRRLKSDDPRRILRRRMNPESLRCRHPRADAGSARSDAVSIAQ